ncbi:MAG: TonB-dependent receptor [Methylotenera sp.]|nr:MAG: TonB-dependent receptor [Methylotenera sp.]
MSSFAKMSLEELGNIEITSVSKKPQSLSEAAASIFIITNEDIRRSSATTLPEALRLAPNLHVAQVSANSYAISARGLNGSSVSAPNKLLVLIDGRSVYSPLFAGVFWDRQQVMLEDVERIEVVSGPGSTLWGVNAVNGVINVITRSAKDTQGILAAVQGGNIGQDAAFRYGGELGRDGHFRVYGKSSNRDDYSLENGTTVSDGWNKNQIGFRMDWNHAADKVSITGNIFESDIGQPQPGSVSVGSSMALGTIVNSGVNLTSQWEHLLDSGSKINFQAYYDRTLRKVPPTFTDEMDIFDVQFQHTLKPMDNHALVWGANYRYSKNDFNNLTATFGLSPEKVNQSWLSLFGQDEIELAKTLHLTLGVRYERNVYTGYEFLPDARLAWQVAPDHLLWTAASRTVRAPSRLDADAFINAAPAFQLIGGPDVRSEIAKVYQLGYRGKISPQFNFEVTAFYNDYDYLRTTELNSLAPIPTFVFANEMRGHAHGVEMWGTYQLLPQWRISAGATALNQKLRINSGSFETSGPANSDRDPSYTWQIRSAFTLSPGKEFDLSVRHVDELTSPDVPAYTAVDARFGWRVHKDVELSVIGQNLFGTEHAEYGTLQTRSEIPQAVFFKVVWQP